jgi:hypothetical protein
MQNINVEEPMKRCFLFKQAKLTSIGKNRKLCPCKQELYNGFEKTTALLPNQTPNLRTHTYTWNSKT